MWDFFTNLDPILFLVGLGFIAPPVLTLIIAVVVLKVCHDLRQIIKDLKYENQHNEDLKEGP